jgi:hypothetical protein
MLLIAKLPSGLGSVTFRFESSTKATDENVMVTFSVSDYNILLAVSYLTGVTDTYKFL